MWIDSKWTTIVIYICKGDLWSLFFIAPSYGKCEMRNVCSDILLHPVGTGVLDGPKGNESSCLCGYIILNDCYKGLQFCTHGKSFVLGPAAVK